MVEVKFYDSLDDMWEDEARMREAADKRVTPVQARMKVGDCYMRYESDVGLVVYGEVLDPCVPAAPYEDVSDEEREEIRQQGEIFNEPHMQHFRFCRCFSQIDDWTVKTGELGNVHVSTMDLPIPRRVFEVARKLGWPNDPTGAKIAEAIKEEGRNNEPEAAP